MKGSHHRFKIGDIVKVKPGGEIHKTLDPAGKLDGCLFMKGMWDHCEREFKVLKVVENVFDEHKYMMYKVTTPLYLLDGLICNGITEGISGRCDRSCYYFWKEEWLTALPG
jgi:hypothetical protein